MPIKRIDNVDVHRIASGQVATSLAACVKELVENSLDAHSSTIEVRFRNYGLDAVEVVDNGDGIAKEDYSVIAHKYHTSKLESFEDLETVHTFGFRGEALSSICAISSLTIVTCTKEQVPKASKLKLNSLGEATSIDMVPGVKGTTITVEDLFKPLPVRRKDFEKNAKREYAKALTWLQAYAVICPAKIMVSNISPSSKKSVLFVSSGTPKQKISTLFGTSTFRTLLPFDLEITWMTKSVLNQLRTGSSQNEGHGRVEGFISQPVFGQGRQSADRQLFYINSRPCDLPQVAKVFNETYRQYNTVQMPFIIADLKLDTRCYDVNVSPDKREILLHDEYILLEALREQLTEFFENAGHTVPISDTPVISKPSGTQSKLSFLSNLGYGSDNSSQSSLSASRERYIDHEQELKEKDDEIPGQQEEEEEEEEEEEQEQEEQEDQEDQEDQDFEGEEDLEMEEEGKSEDVVDGHEDREQESPAGKEGSQESSKGLSEERELVIEEITVNHATGESVGEVSGEPVHASRVQQITHRESPKIRKSRKSSLEVESEDEDIPHTPPIKRKRHSFMEESESLPISLTNPAQNASDEEMEDSLKSSIALSVGCDESGLPQEEGEEEYEREHEHEHEHEHHADQGSLLQVDERIQAPQEFERKYSDVRKATKGKTLNLSSSMSFSASDIISGYKRQKACISESSKVQGFSNGVVRTEIQKDDGNAERMLDLTVKKDDFKKMRVIGQFNLGFILVIKQKPGNKGKDMFIVDQHASDEKYNFERYQRDTVIQKQPLVVPQPLKLSVVDELTLSNSVPILEMNGFTVRINPESPPGTKCSIASLPLSKSTVFDESDLMELLYLIQEDPGNKMVRCSKVRAMFAMRACRSSIMIGEPLAMNTMQRVVKNLAGLDKPWNCPHGRPTLRHLTTIDQWVGFDQDIINYIS
uniref:ARAD1D12122p n=1 Tax=Blastobotrys adeninivorans TaxID=409370 RepID=A0A060T8K1_BLAAD